MVIIIDTHTNAYFVSSLTSSCVFGNTGRVNGPSIQFRQEAEDDKKAIIDMLEDREKLCSST